MGWNTQDLPAWVSSSWTGAGPSGQLPAMDYRPPTLRWVPSWAWRAFYLLLGLGILYQLGAWIWSQLSG